MSTTIDGHRQSREGFSSQCRTGSSEVGDAGVASVAPSRRRRGRSVAEKAVVTSPPEQHQRSSSHTTVSPPQPHPTRAPSQQPAQQHSHRYTTATPRRALAMVSCDRTRRRVRASWRRAIEGEIHGKAFLSVTSQNFPNFEMSNKNKILCLMVDLIDIRK
jgi:transcriptional regulator of met regulon